jgi:hypothetical protein
MVPYTNVESFKTLEAVLAGRYVWSEAGWWAGGEADAFADGVEDIPGWREAVSRRWLGGQEIKEEVPEVPEEPVEEVVEVMEVEEEPVEEEKPKSRKSGSGAKANNRKRKADDEPPVPALKKSRSKSKSKRRR